MIQQFNHLNLEQEIGLKQIMNQKEDMIIVTLDLKRLWLGTSVTWPKAVFSKILI